MASETDIPTRACPKCGAAMNAVKGFVAWCPVCEYGLEGDWKDEMRKNRFEKLYDDLGKRQSQAIFDEILADQQYRPTWSGTRILAYFLAALVHLLSLALAVGGLYLLVAEWGYFLIMLFALLLLVLAWFVAPRPIPSPKENLLARDKFPAFYALVDQVAEALEAQVDLIEVDEQFNASYSRTGYLQKANLTIGLPLWEILTDQERVALLGHEIAHAVNGDYSRHFFVGSAIIALAKWYWVVVPDPLPPPGHTSLMDILMIPVKLFAALIASLIWGYFRLLVVLLYRDKQSAEYLADRLGANIGGRDASIAALRKTYYDKTYVLAVQHCAVGRQQCDLYQEFNELIAGTPETELERLQRLGDRNLTRLDDACPPTSLRIKMLAGQEMQAATIAAESGRMRNIDQELSPFRAKIQAKLVSGYRAAISY